MSLADPSSVEVLGKDAPARVWQFFAFISTSIGIFTAGFFILTYGNHFLSRLGDDDTQARIAFALSSLFGVPAWIVSKKFFRTLTRGY
jgi:hypothetical protein